MKFDGKNIFIVGAGLSVNYPSSIPFAIDITGQIVKWLTQGDLSLEKEILARCSDSNGKNPFDFIRFEAMIHAISLIVPEFIETLSIIEEHGAPNAFHLALMRRIAYGDKILTTNFDNRFEHATDLLDFDPVRIVLSNDSEFRNDQPSPDFVKLHGSFGDTDIFPAAKLNQIGMLGLAFDNFPEFRTWFENESEGKNLYILGYSGLDSFDVVPLIEQCNKARNIIWFDYNRDQSKMKYLLQENHEGSLVPDKETETDLIDICLNRLNRSDCSAWRVVGNDLSRILRDQFPNTFTHIEARFRELTISDEYRTAAKDNIEIFHATLMKEELNDEQQQLIVDRLLTQDEFGAHILRPLDEDEEVAKGPLHTKISSLVKSNQFDQAIETLNQYSESDQFKKNEDYMLAKALIELESDDPASGFKSIREWHEIEFPEIDETTHELELMYAESEFDHYFDLEDILGMTEACEKIKDLAQRYGVIWGLIQWHHKSDRLYEFQALKAVNYGSLSISKRKALYHSRLAAYYSLRTGVEYWFVKFVRRYAMHLSQLNRFGEAALELKRLNSWMVPEDHEERGMTLSSLASNYTMNGEISEASKVVDQMKGLSEERWAIKNIVIELVEVEIKINCDSANKAGLTYRLAHLRSSLDDIDPDDQWNCVEHIQYLLNKIEE